MATGIQIDSVLSLDTSKAERQLKEIAAGVKPVNLPIGFNSTEIERKVAELKKVTFDWQVMPDIEFGAIAKLEQIVGEIQAQSQFKIVPDVGFVGVEQLKRDLNSLRQSTIDINADVNFAELDRLKSEFANLRSQSELRLQLASDAVNIPIDGDKHRKTGEELLAVAREQAKKLDEVTKEQRNTQATVRAESAVSLGNLIKGQIAQFSIGSLKNAISAEFNIDTSFFEKALGNILPSTRILAADIKDMAAKFDEASGGSKRVKKLLDDLLVGFADATAGSSSFEEIGDRFSKTAKESFGEFQAEIVKTKEKMSSFQAVLKAIGIDTNALEYSILTTKTGGSVARGISKTLAKPVAERKDRIQTERLGNVLERAQELSEQKVKQSKKRAKNLANNYKNALAAVDDEVEELLLVIGGYATSANSGVLRAIEINQQLEETGQLGKKAAVGFKNPDIYRAGLPTKQAFPLAVARPNLRGFSRDAEEIAAQAVAALNKHPELKIKLVGESGGGFAVEEAIQILNKLGYGARVQGAGFGTPSLKGKASRSDNFEAYLGTNADEALGYEVKNLFANLGFVDPEVTRPNPKVAQDLKGLKGHPIDNYYKLEEFRKFVLDDDSGIKQTRASIEDIKKLRSLAVDSIINGSAKEAFDLIERFEDNIRITGKAKQPFDQLKTDMNGLANDIEKGLFTELDTIGQGIGNAVKQFDVQQFEGNTDFFNDLKADIPKIRLMLKKIGLEASGVTQEVIDKVNQDLNTLEGSIPSYQTPELLKADYIRRRTDDVLNTLSDVEPEEAIKTITEIEPAIKEYLAGVRALDDSADKSKLQGALEGQLKTIKTARKLALLAVEFDFKELIKNPGEYLTLIKDASLAKAKETAKKKSLNAAQELATRVSDTVDNFVEDFKDRLLEAVEIIKAKALPGSATDTPLLQGGKGSDIVKTGEQSIVKSNLSEAGQALLVRAIADSVVAGKNTYGTLQRIEQGIFDIFPILRATKAITQTAAPVIGGVALASQSPELAALAKLSAQELAIVIQPLIQGAGGAIGDLAGNIPGIGGGARAAIQFLANNSAITSGAASAAGAITAYGAIGGGAGAAVKAGTKLAGRKTFDALPESLKDRLTPEAIAAFDNLVATRQKEIKQLAGTLNKEIAAIKGSDSKEGTQKLLAGYQQIETEIQELEMAVNSSNKTALKKTRDRVTELKGIQKGIRKAINKVGDKSKKVLTNTVESIFDVDVTPVDTKDVSKKTLKKAIADYKNEIINFRKKLEQKILDGTAVDSDFQAGAELAKRGQALSASLKQRRGFSRESRSLSQVSNTLSNKVARSQADGNAIKSGDDVINGILEGTNQKLAQVFIQGRTLGVELLDGFKTELEIKSPAGKFIKEMSDVAAGIVEGRKKERDRIRQAGEDIGQDLFDGSQLSLNEYKELLFNLDDLIQRRDTLKSSTYQQAFDAPDSDISEQLAEIATLEELINGSADAIAAFQENVEAIEVEVEVGEVEEPEVPEVDPIEVEVEVGEAELDDFINNIPDDIDLDVEADTGSSTQRLNRLDRNLEQVRNTARNALRAIVGFGVVRISGAITNQLEDIVRQSIETQIRFEQLETSINFVAGSAEEGAKSLEFVGDTARKLKIDLEVATKGYQQLAAAAKGTDLENETERIFGSITQASRVFGLSGEQTQGAILAVFQMISKGTVQAEELRGQLGERIPGAFQIAARSMNVTTAELGKLLETGQIVSEDFLPKFARQLESETRGGVTGAINTTGAALQGLRASYTQFQLELAKTTKPAQIALYTALAESLELASNNLNILIPASKILTASLITLFLPAIVSLASLLKGAIAKGFNQLLTLLNANTVGMSAFAKAAKVASAALKAFLIIEAISQAIALTHNLISINQEAKEAVKDLDLTYKDFLKTLNDRDPDNEFIQADLVEENQKKVKDELGKTAKVLDWLRKKLEPNPNNPSLGIDLTPKFIKNIPGLGDRNFADSVVDEADELTRSAIKKAEDNLDNIFFDVGTIAEAENEDLSNAVDAINRNISNLGLTDPTTLDVLKERTAALDEQKRLLKGYNDELLRRGGLGKSLARNEVIRQKAVDDATEAEITALNELDKEILASGDLKQDVQLKQLKITQARIDAELAAEQKAIAEFNELAKQRNLDKITKETEKLQAKLNSGEISARDFAIATQELNDKFTGLDPDSGFLKGLSDKEVEAYVKRRDRIIALEKETLSSNIAIANEEVATKIRIYDEYLEEVEGRRQKAEDELITAEKERLIQIQQLVNQDVLSTEQAEDLKAEGRRQRAEGELKQEKKKLRQLKKFKSDEVEAQEKADNDIKASKSKILDLTLSLLEQEKQAEEKTIEAIAQSRDRLFSQLESRLNRLQQIQQTEAGLISDRATAEEKLQDLQLAKLRQALELRKQLNTNELNATERRTLIKQLASLGVEGKTSELALLDKIEDKEKAIADAKLKNLKVQQEFAQQQLELENQQLILSTKKDKIEAKKAQNEAEKQVNVAETAIATAETPEELEAANKQYDLALSSLKLADEELDLITEQESQLQNIIAQKQDILDLNQAIALSELKGTSTDAEFALQKERNAAQEESDRRRGRNLNQYISTQEKIDKQVEGRRQKAEGRGEEFSSEDEEKYRQKLTAKSQKLNASQENAIRKRLLGSDGFQIQASPEVLELIRNRKSFLVPEVSARRSAAPLQTDVLGKTKGSLGEDNMILKTLKNIETKFKQPTVYNVNNQNDITNVIKKDGEDEALRKFRSEQLEMLNTLEQSL